MELVKQETQWYKKLIDDLKVIEFQTRVFGWAAVGDRILKDEEKFGKPEYGEKRIENIAKDMGYGKRSVEKAIQFARKIHTILDMPNNEVLTLETLRTNSTQLGIEGKTWYDIHNNWLPEHKENPQLPTGIIQQDKYNIIYADPPWQYYEGGHKNQSQHYDTMTLEEICQLEVKEKHISEWGADDSLLFMWTTYPMLDQFIDVLRCWGYEYLTVAFTWIKSKKDKTGFFFGNGNWTRANAEICVLGRRGSIPRQDASISQIIYEPIQKHSEKPAIVRDKIVQLVGDLPRLEIFARQKTKGWDIWGIDSITNAIKQSA